MTLRSICFGIAALALFGCGNTTRDVEDYGDIQNQPGGIVLTAENHRGGYGRRPCVLCHNISLNVHRSATSPVDPVALNYNYTIRGGDTYCMSCHLKNGTP